MPETLSSRATNITARTYTQGRRHPFVDPLGEHGILIDAFRRELMLDDGRDDRRRAESSTYAGEAILDFDADQLSHHS